MDAAITPELEATEQWKTMTPEAMEQGGSDIQKFYSGTTVLVTGGTGFVGKLLVEKLLRCCPDIDKLYLLTRPKKNKSIAQRLQEQFDDVLYDRLRKERPNFTDKITVIQGDMEAVGLGMSPEDRKQVINEVEIIFHGAATVRFDEPLQKAVKINVRGTREMWLLAKACGKLKSLVYISTAYSHCTLNEIDERFYENPFPGDKLIDLVETINENVITRLTPGLIGDYPNTYAYTKAAAEDIVLKYSKGLPVAIFRPSIMIATAKEPVAGWIDNLYGPTGIIVGSGVGLLHVLYCNRSAVADLIPGDMVINACIAIGWKTAKEYSGNYEDASPPDLTPSVYNFVSSEQQPLTWNDFKKYTQASGFHVPTVHAVYYYMLYLTHSWFIAMLLSFFLHWIPAYVVDTVAMVIGKQPMLKKAYRKISKFSKVVSYFATREWKFHNENMKRLYTELCDADKRIFDFDPSGLVWSDYFNDYLRGIRIYLVKDPIDTLPVAIKKNYKLKCIHYTLCFILLLLFLALFWGLLCFIVRF